MPRLLWVLTGFVFMGAAALANDEVYLRSKDKPVKGPIKLETPQGVQVAVLKETVSVPWDDIVDINYEVTPVGVRINVYRVAQGLEKDYFDPDPKKEPKRKANLDEAIKKYTEALKEINEKSAKRHLEYKIAVLTARQLQDDGGSLDAAIKKLVVFKLKHAAGWQITPAMRLLAQLQRDSNDIKAAQDTYDELATVAGVSEDVKQEARLLAFETGIRAGKFDMKKLQAFSAGLPAGSKFRLRAKIVEAEGLLGAKKSAEGVTVLRQVIKDAADKPLKAAAYNALGAHYYKTDQLKEAMWEFLWVDTVYFQDHDEHAKALYYLVQVFTKLGDPDRAEDCRDALLSDRAFAGLEWQRLVQKDGAKTP